MPKHDLYKTLGIDKSADKKSIKKAYRKKAKNLHPDTGGTPEKFGALKLAHDILLDDERRHKYDSTGDIDEKTPDNDFSNAVNAVAYAFAEVLQQCAQSGSSPLETEIVDKVRGKMNGTISESNKQIRILKVMLDMDKKLSGRFKTKGKENIFEGIVANRISSLQINISNFENAIKNNEAGLVLIKETSFRKDDKPYESPGDKMMNRMAFSFNTGW